MFGCRRFATSRSEARTMAANLQATAGTISRSQYKAFPSTVASPVDELAQSVASVLNAAVTHSLLQQSSYAIPGSGQPIGLATKALLRQDDHQPSWFGDGELQQSAARLSSSCQASPKGDASMDRARSWYGQRVWTRAVAATPTGPSPSPEGFNTPLISTERMEVPVTVTTDTTSPANVSPHSPAWRFSVMCYNILADTYVGLASLAQP